MTLDQLERTLREGADAIARDLAGPAGAISLDKVVARHLDWFYLVEQRGLSWSQAITLLHRAGAGRTDGTPFARGHLTAVVSRQRAKARARATERPTVAQTGRVAPEGPVMSSPHPTRISSPNVPSGKGWESRKKPSPDLSPPLAATPADGRPSQSQEGARAFFELEARRRRPQGDD